VTHDCRDPQLRANIIDDVATLVGILSAKPDTVGPAERRAYMAAEARICEQPCTLHGALELAVATLASLGRGIAASYPPDQQPPADVAVHAVRQTGRVLQAAGPRPDPET